MIPPCTVTAVSLIAAFAATTAVAQTLPHEPAIPPDKAFIHFQFRPGVWFPRLDGESSLQPGSAISLDEDPDLSLDDSEPAFNLELAARFDECWQADFSGFDSSIDGDGVFGASAQFGPLSIDPGDTYDASFDMTSLSAGFSMWCWKPYERGREGSPVDMWFAPGAGVRWIDVEQTLEIAGEGEARGEGEWISPYVSAEMRMRYLLPDSVPLLDELEIGGLFAIGPALGGDGGIIWHLRATLTAYFTENIGLTFGYRLLEVDAEDDDYELNGGLMGIFAAATIEF